jgi:hypothetical protein
MIVGHYWTNLELLKAKAVGKVLMRIPWVGYIVLFMCTQSGLVLVAVLAALLIIAEFVVPVLQKKTQACLKK